MILITTQFTYNSFIKYFIFLANGVKTIDGKIAETTMISRIFGGYFCNELKCCSCSYSSKTFNHFQDLSLEVSGSNYYQPT